VCLFAGGVNRPDVDELLPGRVRETSPRNTDESESNQNDAKYPIHWRPPLLMTYVDEFGINYVVLGAVSRTVIASVGVRRLTLGTRGSGFIHGFG